jgi:ATP adenylyltransferase
MDYVWSPWRYRYIANAAKDECCVFCRALEANNDPQTLIVHRAKNNFVILNRYPYTSGHVMIVPYAHLGDLAAAPPDTLSEMMLLAQRVEKALDENYHAEGYNLGMNLGRMAGAGITGHIHLHVLPRWTGDASFMTVVSETRVVPEELSTTFERLRKSLA